MERENITPMEEFGFCVTDNQELFLKDLEKVGIVIPEEKLATIECGYSLQLLLEENDFDARFNREILTMVAFKELPNKENDSLYVYVPVEKQMSDSEMFETIHRIFPSIPVEEIGWFKTYDFEDEYEEREADDKDTSSLINNNFLF